MSTTAIGPTEIDVAISEVVKAMAPDVVRIRYDIGTDWSGDPAIYFRIIISDEAGKMPRLHEVATEVAKRLDERLEILSTGFFTYYNVRTVSEHAVLGEDSWGLVNALP